jgi:hypothetical protein
MRLQILRWKIHGKCENYSVFPPITLIEKEICDFNELQVKIERNLIKRY